MKKLLLALCALLASATTLRVQAQSSGEKSQPEIIHEFQGAGSSYWLAKADVNGEIVYFLIIDSGKRHIQNLSVAVGGYKQLVDFGQYISDIIDARDDTKSHSYHDLLNQNLTIISSTRGVSKWVTISDGHTREGALTNAALKNLLKFLADHSQLADEDADDATADLPASPSSAETNPAGHLKFAGVEIDGTLEQFRSRLAEKGFKATNQSHLMSGRFAGRESQVVIYCVEGKDLVRMVVAVRPPDENWTSLYANYKQLVELYRAKYGKPSNSIYKFEYPFDGSEMQMTALKTDKASILTAWKVPNGMILISISNEARIMIYYTDKLNNDVHAANEQERIIDEI
ncbi:hypothetical protein [Alistipes sp.]|uniref:hypothetical protein n=1 Tax=Alistipes sp. TaxID=1872444 RepID=UPI003AF0ED75